jgi:tRNA(adenine34) deaminase
MMDEQWMRFAIAEAESAQAAGDRPFGVVIVRNGVVVGKGRCTNNTGGDVTDHAEVRALRDACTTCLTNDLSDCAIYCTNEPCVMCAGALFQAGIRRVVIALSRDDVPLLRKRAIRLSDIAADSGFPVSISEGVLKDVVLKLHLST